MKSGDSQGEEPGSCGWRTDPRPHSSGVEVQFTGRWVCGGGTVQTRAGSPNPGTGWGAV